METTNSDKNNNKFAAVQRSATFRKRLSGMKNFISSHLKPRARTRSTGASSGDEQPSTKGFHGRRSRTMKSSSSRSLDVKVKMAPNAYLNGSVVNHSSLPQLHKISSTDLYADQHFQGILPISEHDVDTWCSQPNLPIQYSSADNVHKAKSTYKPYSEGYGSIDNVRTRKKKSIKVGSYSYSVECSSSASDVNRSKHVERALRKNSLILRSYSDAQVHTHHTLDILPPMSIQLSQTRNKTPSEVSYNSLNRSEKKFKFEERKKKAPMSFKLSLDSFQKPPSPPSMDSFQKLPSPYSADEQNQLPPIEVKIKNEIVTQASVQSNKSENKNKLFDEKVENNEQPIVVELDPRIFEVKQTDDKSKLFNEPNKLEKNQVIETSINHSTPNKQVSKSGFWDEQDPFQLDDSSIKNIIDIEARSIIAHQSYSYPEVINWTKKITGNVRDKVRAYTGRTFKIVVNCFIGSLLPSNDTVSMAMRSMNESSTDRFVVCAFENEHLFVSVTVLLTRNF